MLYHSVFSEMPSYQESTSAVHALGSGYIMTCLILTLTSSVNPLRYSIIIVHMVIGVQHQFPTLRDSSCIPSVSAL